MGLGSGLRFGPSRRVCLYKSSKVLYAIAPRWVAQMGRRAISRRQGNPVFAELKRKFSEMALEDTISPLYFSK